MNESQPIAPHLHRALTALEAFAPRVVEGARPRIEAIADTLIERMAATDKADVVRDFAFPLPAYVISELFGFPVEDRDQFKQWADRITAFYGAPTDERPTAA